MRLPPEPKFLAKQRYDKRNWSTSDMIEIRSIYWGVVPEQYPQTWQYRTIILAHRFQHLHHAYRKRYGSDWKPEIKPDVFEYTLKGRLPLDSLKLAAEALRAVEQAIWVKTRVEHLVKKRPQKILRLIAAE